MPLPSRPETRPPRDPMPFWPTRRAVVGGLAALFAFRPSRAAALLAEPVRFDLDPGGQTDSAAGLVQAIEEGARTGRPVVIPAGTYAYDSRHIGLTGLGDVTVTCDPGVVFVDRGRMVTGPDGKEFQLPWGFGFRDCHGAIDWTGGIFESRGRTLRGSSRGSFGPDNFHLRKPVFGFARCTGKVRIRGVGHRGSPGRGISGVDRAAIVAALGLDLTPNGYAAMAGNGAFFFADACPDIRREDCYLVPDTCSREQIIFVGCSGGWRNERSWSKGKNMYSLGKVIGCRDFDLGNFNIRDTTTASMVDIIGENISFTDSYFDCPNSKACDVSHEWGPANQPSTNIRIENIRSTGRGVVNATVTSTKAEVAAAPITGLLIRSCQFNIGRTDFAKDVSLQLRGIIDVTVEAMSFLNESPCGYGHRKGAGRSIRVLDCAMDWTLDEDALDRSNRRLLATGVNEYERCSIRARSSRAETGNGLATLPFIGGRHVLRDGTVSDTHFAATRGAVVELHGVTLSSSRWEAQDGSIAFVGCTLDGAVMPDAVVRSE